MTVKEYLEIWKKRRDRRFLCEARVSVARAFSNAFPAKPGHFFWTLVKCLRRENKAANLYTLPLILRNKSVLVVSLIAMDFDDRPKLSVDAEKEITRLWRTWKTVLEMLVDRVRGEQMIWTFF